MRQEDGPDEMEVSVQVVLELEKAEVTIADEGDPFMSSGVIIYGRIGV